MASPLLTTASTLQCLHGGTVSIVSSNTQAQAGAPLALASDTFTVTGCPFQIPASGVPHPCVRVQWTKTNQKVSVNGTPTLSQDSKGVCLAADQAPQGPVFIVQTQPLAGGS
jgi:hypothetical protein